MNWQRNSSHSRAGFTLIELLVVIAIIAVLMALLLPAIFGLLAKGPQWKTKDEIFQLGQAIETFKNEFKVDYIPSQIKLCEKFSDYGQTQLDKDSISYLIRLWPHMGDTWAKSGIIDWNGDGGYTPPVILEGDQCLIYFLGGVPIGISAGTPKCNGFSSDTRDPIKLSQTTGRKGPFWQGFASGRLRQRMTNLAGQKGYLSFYDPYSNDPNKDKPYAFFSSYGVRNGYSPYGASDCASLGIAPYRETANPLTYHGAKTFQIISAGADQQFGPGGVVWTPQTAGSATTGTGNGQPGNDDQANFYDRLLGIGG